MARQPSGKKPSRIPPDEQALLDQLDQALAEVELRRVLAGALLVLDREARARLLARLGADTAAALGPVLDPPPVRRARSPATAAPAAGKAKLRQEWERLWARWDAVVDESGHEKGKYVLQDRHWEAPYIDTSSIADDLEAIAAEMRPLIPRAIEARIAPDFSFLEAVDSMDSDLYEGMPDWIEPGGEESVYLGPEVTACLLRWEWTVAQHEGRDAPSLLDALRDLELGLENLCFDEKAVTDFVLGLATEPLRAVLASVTRQKASARWSEAFTQAHGAWPTIVRELSRRFDPKLHEETSRANIAHDWTLALPLVKSALKRKAHADAKALVDEALRARLRHPSDARWEPRTQLLALREQFYGDENAKLATLLDLWRELARAQGDAALAEALALQAAALRDGLNGDAMLDAFRAVPTEFEALREALFAQWRSLVVERTLRTGSGGGRVVCGDWVSALVDAARVGREGAAGFHSAVRAALEEGHSAPAPEPKPFAGAWTFTLAHESPLHALTLLTRDLDALAPTLKKAAPTLDKLLREEVEGERNKLSATRRAWYERLGGEALVPEVMAFWREHAARFVPDPGDATADYARSADWLAAVRELNPKAADKLLAHWASDYRLKRNLWRDLAARGIPIPLGVQVASPPRRSGRR